MEKGCGDLGPRQLAGKREADEMGLLRSLWCPEYDRCLELALRRGWPSWSCEACTCFRQAAPLRKKEAHRFFDSRQGDVPACAGGILSNL